MNRAARALAVALRPTKPRVRRSDAFVVSVSGSFATVTIDGSSQQVAAVPIDPSAGTITAGSTVKVERSPSSPRIVGRLN